MGFSAGDPAIGFLLGLTKTGAETAAGVMGADATASAAGTNAALAELQAKDAIDRGKADAARYGKQFQKLAGSLYSRSVASGVDPTFGSAANFMDETYEGGALDLATLRANAQKEALGFKAQANNLLNQQTDANLAAGGSLLKGILTGGAQWYNFERERPKTSSNRSSYSEG